MTYFFIVLVLTVITHELGQAVAALLNNISVKVVSIGLFKPYLTFKVKKIKSLGICVFVNCAITNNLVSL